MSGAEGWTLLGLVGVLLSVMCSLVVGQMQMRRSYLDVRFDGMDHRFDHLDRDVQSVTDEVFRRGRD